MKIIPMPILHSHIAGTPTVSPADGWCDACKCHHVARSPESKTFQHPTECPKARQSLLPVLLIGAAGTGVGSRIGGHARRGGGKMRKEHIQRCTIGMTNEYRSPQTCIFCFQPVQLARSRRLIGGKIKVTKVHGAVECVNPACSSFKCGYTIKPRDPHASVCIKLSISVQGYNGGPSRSGRFIEAFTR